jgi:hypothetical protein
MTKVGRRAPTGGEETGALRGSEADGERAAAILQAATPYGYRINVRRRERKGIGR